MQINNILFPLSQKTYKSGNFFSNAFNIFPFLNLANKKTLIEKINCFNFLQYFLKPNHQISIDSKQNDNNICNDYISINKINPTINNFDINRRIIPQYNTQLNSGANIVVPSTQDICFLNKKRNDLSLSAKENEIIYPKTNTSQHLMSLKDNDKTTDSSNLDSLDTKRISNGESFLKEFTMHIKEDSKENKIEINNSLLAFHDKINKEEKKQKQKRRKKMKEKFSELLQDTILKNIGKSTKTIKTTVNDIRENIVKSSINKTNINNINNLSSKYQNNSIINLLSSLKENSEKSQKLKEKKIKIKTQTKKKQYNLTIKNNNKIFGTAEKNQSNEIELNPKLTKVIFHGENYKNTTSSIDFMKYNFDFIIEEQYKTKKLITNYNEQHIDMLKIEPFYNNYNQNNQNLDEIKLKWSRDKFIGNNKELKNALNIIKDTFPGSKVDVDEENCLKILKNNDYNINNFLKFQKVENLVSNK